MTFSHRCPWQSMVSWPRAVLISQSVGPPEVFCQVILPLAIWSQKSNLCLGLPSESWCSALQEPGEICQMRGRMSSGQVDSCSPTMNQLQALGRKSNSENGQRMNKLLLKHVYTYIHTSIQVSPQLFIFLEIQIFRFPKCKYKCCFSVYSLDQWWWLSRHYNEAYRVFWVAARVFLGWLLGSCFVAQDLRVVHLVKCLFCKKLG